MKTGKQFVIMAIIAILGVMAGFIACDNGNNPPPAHVHQWGEWTVTTPATCATAGVQTRVCDLDATHTETQSIAIDPNAHQWGAWTITTPATATSEGVETRTCAHNAAHQETRTIERTEPAKKEFTVILDFGIINYSDGSSIKAIYNVAIQDIRTNCGSQNLEQLEVLTIIEKEIMGASTSFPFSPQGLSQKNGFRMVFAVDGGVTIYVNNPSTLYKIKATDDKTIYFHIDYLKSNSEDIQQKIKDAVSAMGYRSGTSLPYIAE